MVAPGGNSTFTNGCAWFFTHIRTWNGDPPIPRDAHFTFDDKGCFGNGRLEEMNPERGAGTLPIADRWPVHFVDDKPLWKRQRDVLRRSLHNLHVHRR
jgi:hypothetical protein